MTPRANMCSCCREEREKEHLGPRAFERLPIDILQTGFQRPGLPILVCVHCDGDVYRSAMRTHEERAKK
jgi:hypothetical protein